MIEYNITPDTIEVNDSSYGIKVSIPIIRYTRKKNEPITTCQNRGCTCSWLCSQTTNLDNPDKTDICTSLSIALSTYSWYFDVLPTSAPRLFSILYSLIRGRRGIIKKTTFKRNVNNKNNERSGREES